VRVAATHELGHVARNRWVATVDRSNASTMHCMTITLCPSLVATVHDAHIEAARGWAGERQEGEGCRTTSLLQLPRRVEHGLDGRNDRPPRRARTRDRHARSGASSLAPRPRRCAHHKVHSASTGAPRPGPEQDTTAVGSQSNAAGGSKVAPPHAAHVLAGACAPHLHHHVGARVLGSSDPIPRTHRERGDARVRVGAVALELQSAHAARGATLPDFRRRHLGRRGPSRWNADTAFVEGSGAATPTCSHAHSVKCWCGLAPCSANGRVTETSSCGHRNGCLGRRKPGTCARWRVMANTPTHTRSLRRGQRGSPVRVCNSRNVNIHVSRIRHLSVSTTSTGCTTSTVKRYAGGTRRRSMRPSRAQ